MKRISQFIRKALCLAVLSGINIHAGAQVVIPSPVEMTVKGKKTVRI